MSFQITCLFICLWKDFLAVLELRDTSASASQVLELKVCVTADNLLITRLLKIKGTQLLSQLINDLDNDILDLRHILEDRLLEEFVDKESILCR